MAISKEKSALVNEFEERSYVRFKSEILPRITTNLIKNSAAVIGSRKKDFFRRQGVKDQDFNSKSIAARFIGLLGLIYFTDVGRGEKLIQFIESYFASLRSINAPPLVKKDFLEEEEEILSLYPKRRQAWFADNKQRAREITAAIIHKEQQMPVFLRKTRTRKRAAACKR